MNRAPLSQEQIAAIHAAQGNSNSNSNSSRDIGQRITSASVEGETQRVGADFAKAKAAVMAAALRDSVRHAPGKPKYRRVAALHTAGES